MEFLREYIDILSLINIIILTSIIILSGLLCILYKNVSFMIILLLHCLELSVSVYNSMCNDLIQHTIISTGIIILTKVFILVLFYKKINFRYYVNIILLLGYGLCFITRSKVEISLIISISLNIFIVYFGIIGKVKSEKKSLIKNRHKLKINKKYISKSMKEIQSESSLNNVLNEKVKKLNNKIESTIEVFDLPIFILNEKNNYIYGNSEFNKILEGDNVDLKNWDLDKYLRSKIINYNEMIDLINYFHKNEYICVKTYDNKIFKFNCTFDLINNSVVKICILKDITYDFEMKNILKESEDKYRKLMDILNDGVIIHNLDTVSYINDKALELFDISTEVKKVILIKDIKNKITNKSKDKFMNNLKIGKNGLDERIVNKLETEDGRVIEFITTLITLDNTPMMLSMAIDITDLEYTKEKIIESEKTYKLLLQALPEGVVKIDKKTGDYTYRNKSMIKILKHIGLDKFNEIVEQYKANCEYGKFEKFSIKDDKKLNLSMAITDFKDEDNLVCLVRILDDEYRAEQMVEKLNEMEDKYKFKTEFLYTISSNLKKPINTIFEVNKVLNHNKEKYNEKYIDNYARVVKQNSYRLKRLLNNIEEISKIENGIIEMNYSKCDVVKFVEEIVKLSKSYAHDKNLDILFITNTKKKVILIDKAKIEKILLNLLSNAMKFTNTSGKIMVSVNVNKEKTIISVEDTGVGIPNEKINSIFENFEQIDTTLSRGAEGTGVGLALVKKLVNTHNAKINVYSKVGYGSKFEIILKNDNVVKLEENKEDTIKNIDTENIDIEFSDIYFDLGS